MAELTQEEAMIGESAVRLGDQARVRRALDKVIRVKLRDLDSTTVDVSFMIDGISVIDQAADSVSEELLRQRIEEVFVHFLAEVLRG